MTVKINLTPTQLAILVLLRAEDIKGNAYSAIPGKTHLVKEIFAIQKTAIGEKLLPELKFEPDNYGPFDETIYAALDGLKDAGFVTFDSTSNNYVKIALTEKGKETSDHFWKKLKDEVKSIFKYVKINFNHLSSENVLEKIYAAYPELTVNSLSKVADKYRPKKGLAQ
jgi:DNA-binding PadR family transcriptional regulator